MPGQTQFNLLAFGPEKIPGIATVWFHNRGTENEAEAAVFVPENKASKASGSIQYTQRSFSRAEAWHHTLS